MKSKIRWKAMATFLLAMLPVVLVLYAYLSHVLRDQMLAATRGGLDSECRLARLMAEREISALEDAPAAAAAIGKEIHARITFIAGDGTVRGDSEVPAKLLGTLENHLDRPEVRDALRGTAGSSARYSATLHTTMLYVALPLTTKGGEKGVIRLALPFSELDTAVARMRKGLAASLALAALLSLFLSFVLSGVITRYLRSIAAGASRIGKGELGHRIPVRTDDELGELATAVNEMADRMEEQLWRMEGEKKRLDAILRGMGEGIMVADADGTVTLVNPAFERLFGSKGVEAKPLLEATRHPVLHETFRDVVATGGECWKEVELHSPERTLLTHWVPLREEGVLRGVVAVFHDISSIKRLEQVRRDFVANVSHELRTPVAVIRGYAETLLSGGENEPETTARFLKIIHDQSERLGNLIRDLLTLSHLESAGSPREPRPVRAEEMVRTALSLLEGKAREKEIAIDLSGLGGATVLADSDRLQQVFINLLDNALKHTPPGGRITVTAEETGETVRISVADTGIGIPPKHLPRIFERFYRVDPARSRGEGGTGLGLAIVKHIVQLHGGDVSVESTPGKGSVFSFTLKKG
jgi:two-component system, OmpR family, phosphate regulon sensor histidine kinase PhoR